MFCLPQQLAASGVDLFTAAPQWIKGNLQHGQPNVTEAFKVIKYLGETNINVLRDHVVEMQKVCNH